MIKAVFTLSGDDFIGFIIEGHAGYAEHGKDIVCSGVSSAIMLTINTITDFFGADAKVDLSPDNEGYAYLMLNKPYNKTASTMIKSFHTHLELIKEDYGHIKVCTEVK